MPRTWAPKGVTPRMRYNYNWKKPSAIGGIDPLGEIYFRVHEGSVTNKEVTEYLDQLLRHVQGHIVVLWDGLPAHRARAVKELADEHSDRLTIYRLPAYCPDFNPMEWLWAYVKWGKMKGYCPKTLGELKTKLKNCIRSLRRRPEMVQSFFSASSLQETFIRK